MRGICLPGMLSNGIEDVFSIFHAAKFLPFHIHFILKIFHSMLNFFHIPFLVFHTNIQWRSEKF